MKTSHLILALVGFFSCFFVGESQRRRIPWRKDKSNNIAVRFTSKSCSLCEASLDDWVKMERTYNNTVHFYQVDCDVQTRLCAKMNVTTYPSIQLRTNGDWNPFLLQLKHLNATLESFPRPCHFPEQASSCHPKTLKWIKDHGVKDVEKFENDYFAEEEMYNIGIADLTKNFLEKKMMWIQLKQWRDYKNTKADL